ncbi:beta-CASP ribonuclease aCPSF1 [archaeon]|nr:beta-CASP ribonuclease aCPSF1 [archaeon]|tara:strand:+ start:3633 stop:5528 length:1896 start_codon:yes stop_codon:yes gene_type:complete
MTDIIKEIQKELPKDSDVSEINYEGANIVIYTKNKEFFSDNKGIIKTIVDKIKKRVELRADPSILLDPEKAEDKLAEIIPKEAGVDNIIFDQPRSQVIIEAEKPGLTIGKAGEILHKIKRETMWSPTVNRTPSIKSKITDNIRQVLYENNDYRKKFLNSIGKKIYNGWQSEKKQEWVRVSFLGAARQVGRSCFLLQTQESKVLLDCGIDVASEGQDAYPYLDVPEFDIKELDAVIVSHPHTDHVGFLPYLFKMGYKGPVYLTHPTRDIGALLCLDYVSISEKEAKKPLYTTTDIKEMVKHTVPLDYNEVTDITPDIRITFVNAGHVLGSAMVHIHIGNGLHNLLYSGDLNYENTNLLAAAVTKFHRLETLIIEGTYGGKDDIPPSRQEAEEEIIKIIKETLDRSGKVLMPVLGIGRSQEVALILERLMREGKIKQVPIYVQGLVWDITAIHTAYPDYFNARMRKEVFHKDQNPFLSDIFKRVGSQKEMKQVMEGGPCIIMATSGMMVGGPSVEYFKNLADNKNNSLIFTCYQGPGSLGRRISQGDKEINLGTSANPEIIKIAMDIHALHGLSGHANRQQLINFMRNLDPKPKKVIIVHAESNKCLEIASTLHKMFRIETVAPKNLEVVRIK